jgi:hypothetical protein
MCRGRRHLTPTSPSRPSASAWSRPTSGARRTGAPAPHAGASGPPLIQYSSIPQLNTPPPRSRSSPRSSPGAAARRLMIGLLSPRPARGRRSEQRELEADGGQAGSTPCLGLGHEDGAEAGEAAEGVAHEQEELSGDRVSVGHEGLPGGGVRGRGRCCPRPARGSYLARGGSRSSPGPR